VVRCIGDSTKGVLYNYGMSTRVTPLELVLSAAGFPDVPILAGVSQTETV